MATPRPLTKREKHPEGFLPETNIDRRTCKRTVPMEILNLSFPRTGTMSLHTALTILGYPCYHSIAFFQNLPDTTMWNAAMDAKFFGTGPPFTLTEWDQLLGAYRAYRAVSADPPPSPSQKTS
ncbi:hypothetical protein MMC30_005572 [Trapelia coarctata]|nr:hypothetical protein [Trapelia coarctata]